MIVRGQKRRTSMSLRRSIILNAADPSFDAGNALILRWIGAAARKRGKVAQRPPRPLADNVTILKWEHTFGRMAKTDTETMDSQVVVVQFKPVRHVSDR